MDIGYIVIEASAAISSLPRHAATLLTSEGSFIDARCYEHGGE